MFSGSYLNSWSSHLHPYVPPQPPPPPVMHKVYILDCAHCKTFLTNRGMKAVLLLRPSVALYSSDALPVNCSVYASPQALRSTCPAPPNNRSCECLTQSLACHTCGAFVGYAIVLPCVRCTSSISTPNRSTNGHRFVFHSAEIVGTERHYIHQETGVMVTSPPPLAAALHNTVYYRSPATSHHSQALAAVSRPEYLETPSLDGEDSDPPSPVAASFSGSSAAYPAQLLPVNQAHPYQRAASPASSESSTVSLPPLVQHSPPSFGLPMEHFETPIIPPLAPGDVVYWHHLVKHGEIPGVSEDVRARRRSLAMQTGRKVQFNR